MSKEPHLIAFARILNDHNIRWNLGGSAMLYVLGIVKSFNDIDIIVHEEDLTYILELFNEIPKTMTEHNLYKTTYFHEFIWNDIDIDIMIGLSVVKNDVEFQIPWSVDSLIITLEGVDIHLSDWKQWKEFYQLIGRESTVAKIVEWEINNV